MNQRQIQCFLVVAENASFTKAGEHLFMTQPAVSKQISSLETEMGVSLFFRSRHKCIELTTVGRLYYDFFSKYRKEFHQVQRKAMDLNQQIKGELRLGVLTGWKVSALLESSLLHFKTLYPNIEVQLFFQDLEPLRESVSNGRLDVIVTIEDSLYNNKLLEKLFLEKVPRVILYSRKHPAAKKHENPKISDFCQAEFEIVSDVTFDSEKLVYEYLAPYEMHPKIQLVPSIEAAIARTHGGMGVTVIDAWSREMENAAFGHIFLDSCNQAVLVWDPENQNPAVAYFLNEFSGSICRN